MISVDFSIKCSGQRHHHAVSAVRPRSPSAFVLRSSSALHPLSDYGHITDLMERHPLARIHFDVASCGSGTLISV
jgi:hypothetical protein